MDKEDEEEDVDEPDGGEDDDSESSIAEESSWLGGPMVARRSDYNQVWKWIIKIFCVQTLTHSYV